MAKTKNINERCPFHDECERTKCEHIHSESGCGYYYANARPGAEIADQNTIPYPDILDEADEPMTSELVYLPIEALFPHPDNPRKDLGDLTELADSIKANGVMQNLTVVPFKSKTNPNFNGEGKYTIVIGHRRHAAAEIAGLTMLPCIITEMSYEDQIATMAIENMQRSDLTVYEQAKVMQTMLDLGVKVEQISEKTGFSQTTVRRRVKLLDLDEKEFIKSVDRGATLFDYAELDKIKDPELKNKVLKHIGTDNFKNELKKTIDFEKDKEYIDSIEAEVAKFATKIEETKGYSYQTYYGIWSKPKFEKPNDAESVEYFYTRSDREINLYTKREDVEVDEETKRLREERAKAEENRRAELNAASSRAYELRSSAMGLISNNNVIRHLSAVIKFVLKYGMSRTYGFIYKDKVLKLLDIDLEDETYSDMDEDRKRWMVEEQIDYVSENTPGKMLLQVIYMLCEDTKNNRYDIWGDYRSNKQLDCLYELLCNLGYSMSDEEKALQKGTHELFIHEESEESE